MIDKHEMIEKIEELLEIQKLKSFNNMYTHDIKIIYDRLILIDEKLTELQKKFGIE